MVLSVAHNLIRYVSSHFLLSYLAIYLLGTIEKTAEIHNLGILVYGKSVVQSHLIRLMS